MFINKTFLVLLLKLFVVFTAYTQTSGSAYVDHYSGDFKYPLLLTKISGGDLSIPLQLQYTSGGISHDQEASWTGLGWQLEPGAIYRVIKGYPDDYSSVDEKYYENGLASPEKISKVYGMLRGKDATSGVNPGSVIPLDRKFDVFSLFDPAKGTIGESSFKDPNFDLGGTFPNEDDYYIGVPGFSGVMKPFLFENGTLYNSYREEKPYGFHGLKYVLDKPFTKEKADFRFVNDFTNSLKVNSVSNYSYDGTGNISYPVSSGFGFSYTSPTNGVINGSEKYFIPGSNHVEYFFNSEISSGSASQKGFINYPGSLSRNIISLTYRDDIYQDPVNVSYDVANVIGGFSITSSSGITYHFAIPVYAYELYQYNKDSEVEELYEINQPYAYKWLLTSITGPDFYDGNNNGIADEGDRGSWINYAYTRTNQNFIERTPFEGYSESDNGNMMCSAVRKELYFLDAIFSNEEVVLFETFKRSDYQGSSTREEGGDRHDRQGLELTSGLSQLIKITTEGLKKIRLEKGFSSTTFFGDIQALKRGNKLEKDDILALENEVTNFPNLIIDKIKFDYDYSICPQSSLIFTDVVTERYGKLTLKGVSVQGGTGEKVTPDYKFNYELENPITENIYISQVPSETTYGRKGKVTASAYTNFQSGDIIKFIINGKDLYCTLLDFQISGMNKVFNVIFLGRNIPEISYKSITCQAEQTKNPPYTKEQYDSWGHFKSDYIQECKNRKTSLISAKSLDVWSLRSITNPLGASFEIVYEPDVYSKIVANDGRRIIPVDPRIGFKPVHNIQDYSGLENDGTFYFHFNFRMSDLNRSLSKHQFKLKFLEPNALEALSGLNVGDKVTMATLSSFMASDLYGVEKVPIIEKGVNYIVVEVTRYSPGLGLIPLVSDYYNHFYCSHQSSYLIVDDVGVNELGGGTRVKKLIVVGKNESFEKVFSYEKNGSSLSSGIISLDPLDHNCIPDAYSDIKRDYSGIVFGNLDPVTPAHWFHHKENYFQITNDFLSFGNFVPSPSVGYEYVSEKTLGNGIVLNSFNTYHFKPLQLGILHREVLYEDNDNGLKTLNIKDLSSSMGQLLSVTEYDLNNNPLTKTSYSYAKESDIPNDQGILEQVFHIHRRMTVYGSSTDYPYSGVVSIKSTLPSVLLGVEKRSFIKGTVSEERLLKFDIFNGQPTESVEKDANGVIKKIKHTYAYNLPIYNSMGLKAVSPSNDNILNLVASSYFYKADPLNFNNNLGILSAAVTTYSNNWKRRKFVTNPSKYVFEELPENVWRENSKYVYKTAALNSDGTFETFSDFDWTLSNIDSHWEKVTEVSNYNEFSNLIEVKDINSNFSSLKFSCDNKYIISKTSYSNFVSSTYSGFEKKYNPTSTSQHFDGEMFHAQNQLESSGNIKPHTGKYMLQVAGYTHGYFATTYTGGENELMRGGKYRASVWMHADGDASSRMVVHLTGSRNGQSYSFYKAAFLKDAIFTAGKWNLVVIDFEVPADYVSSGGTFNDLRIYFLTDNGTIGYVDDFRLHPVESNMTSYVYDDDNGRLTYVIDENNLYTRYEFDVTGRLKAVYRETKKGEVKVSEYNYNFSRQNEMN